MSGSGGDSGATRTAAWRFCLAVVLMSGALSGTGCISVPQALRGNVSPEGASATRVWNVLGLRWVETVSFVPGRSTGRHDAHRLTCGGRPSYLSIQWGEGTIGAADVADLCRSAVEALDYIAAASGLDTSPVGFRLVLVPKGQGLTVRSFGTTAFGRLRPRFVKPVMATMPATVEDVQTTLAHEFTHIAAALRGMGTAKAADEEIAWLAGYCASFQVLGHLSSETLIHGQLPEGAKAPASAVRSNRSGAVVSATIRAIAGGDGLRKGTAAGDRLEALCSARLGEYFG